MIISDLEYIKFILEQAGAINGGTTEVLSSNETSTLNGKGVTGKTTTESLILTSDDPKISANLLGALPMGLL